MADLIDRQAALKSRTYMWDEYIGTAPCVFCEDIEKLPAVDAVEVVRCKDCKHMSLVMSHVNGAVRFCTVWSGANGMGDDGYCNYGERRGDDAAD